MSTKKVSVTVSSRFNELIMPIDEAIVKFSAPFGYDAYDVKNELCLSGVWRVDIEGIILEFRLLSEGEVYEIGSRLARVLKGDLVVEEAMPVEKAIEKYVPPEYEGSDIKYSLYMEGIWVGLTCGDIIEIDLLEDEK